LPDSLGEPEGLKYLRIEAPRLTALPENLRMLQGLEHLHMSAGKGEVIGMEALPDTIGELQALKQLELLSFFRVESLPDSLKSLKSLERLKLHGFERLAFLPKTLGELRGLKLLELSSCTDLRGLPDTIVGISALEKLAIFHCNQLNTLPDKLGELQCLKHIQTQSGQISDDCQESLKRHGFRLDSLQSEQLQGRKEFEPEMNWYRSDGLLDLHKEV
jgi:Leucine-rich repeat (LRR) protein